MIQPSTLLLVDADARGLETLTFGFERDGYKVTSTSDLGRAPQLAKTTSASLAIVSLREPETSGLDVIGALRAAAKDLAVVALGPAGMKPEALGAGAADFLALPIFLRDVISVGKLSALDGRRPRDGATDPDEIQMRLSEHYGLFYLLRAMASSERSGVLQLNRGNRRAELRIHEGTVVSASVGALQGLPALHHMLLWEEAALSLTRGTVRTRSQLHLSAQEVLDECERFLRDFAHAARDLGAPRTLYVATAEPQPAVRGLQPSQVTPLLRLFDGRRVLSDVIEESPFRIFDTVRMIRRLRDGGVLAVRPEEKPEPARKTPPGGPAIPRSGPPRSMFEQWAMVPDQRGVVGDRRSTNRKLRPLQTPLRAAAAPLAASAPRRSTMTPPRTAPLANPLPRRSLGTPLGTAPLTVAPIVVAPPAGTPIPLTNKKGVSASGEIAGARLRPTPADATANLLAVAPTIQVQLDGAGVPVEEPRAPAAPPIETTAAPILHFDRAPAPVVLPAIGAAPLPEAAPAPIDQAPLDLPPPVDAAPPVQASAGSAEARAPQPMAEVVPSVIVDPELPAIQARNGEPLPPAIEDAPPPKLDPPAPRTVTPRPRRISGNMSEQEAFDAIESDFFAREADLYKREAIETFDDLDPIAGLSGSGRSRKK